MTSVEAPHLPDGRLIDLESGLLDPASRARAMEHLRTCAACEARLREAHGDAERLALRPAPRLGMGSGTTPSVARPARPPARPLLWAAAAAALLVAAAVPWVLRRGLDDGLDYWLPGDANVLLARSAVPLEDDALYREAIAAYDRRDVAQVIALLDSRAIPPEYAPLNLLLASALEREGRHARARAVLERLDVETLPQPARDQARWILYVSLRRDGRDGEARQVALDLARGEGTLARRARAALAGSQSGK
jgi:hypothetical protein